MQCESDQQTRIDILEFDPGLTSDFRRLNIEWLQGYFVIEPADDLVLNRISFDKMAVTRVYQTRGIGRRLLHAALDKYKISAAQARLFIRGQMST